MGVKRNNIAIYVSAIILLLIAIAVRAEEPSSILPPPTANVMVVADNSAAKLAEPASIASSAPQDNTDTQDTKSPAPIPPSAPGPPPGPLMGVLDHAGLTEHINNARLGIYGYVEGGYMHDFTSPGFNDGATFI